MMPKFGSNRIEDCDVLVTPDGSAGFMATSGLWVPIPVTDRETDIPICLTLCCELSETMFREELTSRMSVQIDLSRNLYICHRIGDIVFERPARMESCPICNNGIYIEVERVSDDGISICQVCINNAYSTVKVRLGEDHTCI